MKNKSINILRYSCLLFVIVFGLMAIIGSNGGGVGDDGGGDSITSPIVGVWVGECHNQSMELEFESNWDMSESDDLGGLAYGTYTYNNGELCMTATYTNDEGCTPPDPDTYCSDVTISNDILTFLDFNPGTGDYTFAKK